MNWRIPSLINQTRIHVFDFILGTTRDYCVETFKKFLNMSVGSIMTLRTYPLNPMPISHSLELHSNPIIVNPENKAPRPQISNIGSILIRKGMFYTKNLRTPMKKHTHVKVMTQFMQEISPLNFHEP